MLEEAQNMTRKEREAMAKSILNALNTELKEAKNKQVINEINKKIESVYELYGLL